MIMMILSQGWQGQMHDMGWMMGGWFGWLSMLVSLGFALLLAVGLVVLIRYLWLKGGSSGDGKAALDILKERYARGEIGQDEYQRMRQELQ